MQRNNVVNQPQCSVVPSSKLTLNSMCASWRLSSQSWTQEGTPWEDNWTLAARTTPRYNYHASGYANATEIYRDHAKTSQFLWNHFVITPLDSLDRSGKFTHWKNKCEIKFPTPPTYQLPSRNSKSRLAQSPSSQPSQRSQRIQASLSASAWLIRSLESQHCSRSGWLQAAGCASRKNQASADPGSNMEANQGSIHWVTQQNGDIFFSPSPSPGVQPKAKGEPYMISTTNWWYMNNYMWYREY